MSYDLTGGITPEQMSKLNELERREFNRLNNDKWYRDLKPNIKKVVDAFPPFYVYRLKDTGHLGFIYSYEDKKDDMEVPVSVTMKLTPQYNSDLVAERLIAFVPPEALERIMLRRVADMEQIISTGVKDRLMPKLANRVQAVRESNSKRRTRLREEAKWKAENKTQISMSQPDVPLILKPPTH